MATRFAWVIAVLVAGAAAASAALVGVDYASGHREDPAMLTEIAGSIVFAGVGALIVTRLPANRIGWVCIAAGATYALARLASEYAVRALVVAPGSLPGGLASAVVAAVATAAWWPAGSLLLLWFPTGRPASSRWALVAWLSVVGGAAYVLIVTLASPRLETDTGEFLALNPAALPFSSATLRTAGFNVVFVLLLLSATSLVWRLKSASGATRQQLKVLVYVCALIVVLGALLAPIYELNPNPRDTLLLFENLLWYVMTGLLILGIPIAIGIAILRYRLYDIDLVISRTLLFGSLAAFITGVYVAVVVGVGQLFHAGSQHNLLLSVLATSVVAVAFDPVRRRLQRLANRIVYGHRASPYEVLAEFSTRVSGIYSGDEILGRIARILAEGLRASLSVVFVRREVELEPAAVWPAAGTVPGPIRLDDGQLGGGVGLERIAEVRHQGELLGALGVQKPRGERLSPVEEQLLADLAAQAGAVLHNVRLKAQLEERVQELSGQEAELRRSRERIVAAQDAERRRLERNIHDGAQQHLVALAVKIRLARTLSEKNPEKAAALIEDLKAEVAVAQQTLRDLAGGIYPASLRERGLASALRAEAATLGIDLELTAGGLERHPEDVEAAAYFCCLEALQNVAKHAPGSRVSAAIEDSGEELRFEVRDDGPGFDPAGVRAGSGLGNMVDRAAAFGGSVTIDSAPGRGVTVRGRIPIPAATSAA